jgi:hypothetical protein
MRPIACSDHAGRRRPSPPPILTRSRDPIPSIGRALLLLTPPRFQRGGVDYDGHISRRGDGQLSVMGAAVLLTPVRGESALRRWGLVLWKRLGFKRGYYRTGSQSGTRSIRSDTRRRHDKSADRVCTPDAGSKVVSAVGMNRVLGGRTYSQFLCSAAQKRRFAPAVCADSVSAARRHPCGTAAERSAGCRDPHLGAHR